MACRLLVLVALTGLAPAASELPGLPQVARPGGPPGMWIAFGNDSLGGGFGTNDDDMRTHSVSGGLRLGSRWAIAADLSTLTWRDGPAWLGTGTRIDEITVSATRLWEGRRPDGYANTFIGLALRNGDDYGGEWVQDTWHEYFNFSRVNAVYESSYTSVYGVAGGQWLRHWPLPWHTSSGWLQGTRLGLVADGGALVGPGVDTQIAVGVRGVVVGHDGGLWLGIRKEIRAGRPQTLTGHLVAEAERGDWFVYGANAGWFLFEAAYHLESGLSWGKMALIANRPGIHEHRGDDLIRVEFGTNLDAFGIDIGLRWQPYWLADLGWLGERSTLMLDYGYGRSPQAIFSGSVRYQQALLGWDLAWSPPADGFDLTPFIYAGAGWRQEDISEAAERPQPPRYAAEAGVVQTGVGLRATWGAVPSTRNDGLRYGLSLAHNWWWPWQHASVLRHGYRTDYLVDDQDTSIRVLIEFAW